MNKTPTELIDDLIKETNEKGMYLELISPRIRHERSRTFVNTILSLSNINIKMAENNFYYVYIKEDSVLKKQPDEVIKALVKEFHNSYTINMKAHVKEEFGEIGEKAVADAYDGKPLQIYIDKEDRDLTELMDIFSDYIVQMNNNYLKADRVINTITEEYDIRHMTKEEVDQLLPIVKERCDLAIEEYADKSDELFKSMISYAFNTFHISPMDGAEVDGELRTLNVDETYIAAIEGKLEAFLVSNRDYLKYYMVDLQGAAFEKGIYFHIYSKRRPSHSAFMTPIIKKKYGIDLNNNTIMIYVTNKEISDEYALQEIKNIINVASEELTDSLTFIIKREEKDPLEAIEKCIDESVETLDRIMAVELDTMVDALHNANVVKLQTAVHRIHNVENIVNDTMIRTISSELGMTEEEVKNIPNLNLFSVPLDKILEI